MHIGLGMTFSDNVIPCQLSRHSQNDFHMSYWWVLHGLINRYDFLIKSHTVYLILTWADMTLWMSYRLLVSDIHWYDLIKSYRVLYSSIWLMCVWLSYIWLKMSYMAQQNDFWVLCHTEWLSGQVWKVIPCLCSMTLLIYVIPFLF